MPDPRMYESNTFVLLEPGQPEQFLTAEEMLKRLETALTQQQHDLPRDLQNIPSIQEQAQHLLDTSCELSIGLGQNLQWYAVRLEK